MQVGLVLAGIFSVAAAGQFSGEATAYGDAWQGGNCGFTEVSAKAQKYFAAMNNEQYQKGLKCGLCAKITCTDSRCKSKTPITVQVTNRCPECKKGDIDLSNTGFKELTGSDPSRYKITWDWTDCKKAGFVSGNMKLWLKEGSSRWWYAVQPRNNNKEVKNVYINGQKLQPPGVNTISSYFFMDSKVLPEGKLKFEVETVDGQKKAKTVDKLWTPGSNLDLGFNF